MPCDQVEYIEDVEQQDWTQVVVPEGKNAADAIGVLKEELGISPFAKNNIIVIKNNSEELTQKLAEKGLSSKTILYSQHRDDITNVWYGRLAI